MLEADDALDDAAFVVRKIPSAQLHPIDGGRRVSAGAFSASSEAVDPERGMSVDSCEVLAELGIDPSDPKQFAPEFEVVAKLSVRTLKAMGLKVVARPLENNKAHCNVLGVRSSSRKKILDSAEFIRRPSDLKT